MCHKMVLFEKLLAVEPNPNCGNSGIRNKTLPLPGKRRCLPGLSDVDQLMCYFQKDCLPET